MGYSPKCHRKEVGVYTVTFGKGQKQLTATIALDAGEWIVTDGGASLPAFKTKRELLDAWGAWAQEQYEGTGSYSKPPSRPTPPVPSRAAVPPVPSRRRIEPASDQDVLPTSETGDIAACEKHAQALHDGLASILHWAWRNRKDLNTLPWRDGMVAIARTNPDLHAKLKLASP